MIQSKLNTVNQKILQWVLVIICFSSINAFAIEDARVWKNIGPDGAKISTLAISKSEPNIVYAITGVLGDSLFKSVDGGVEWEFVQRDNSESYYPFKGLLVDPGNPQNLFLLAREGFTPYKQIILRSRDGGINWNEIKLKDGAINASFIAINTPLSDSLRAVIDLKNGERTIALSHDGGESWEVSETIINPIDDIKVDVVGIDPKNPKILYGVPRSVGNGIRAEMEDVEYVLHKSIDGGGTWSSIQPIGDLTTGLGFQIHPVKSNILYALFHGSIIDEGLPFGTPGNTEVWFSSNDGGENWKSFGELGELLKIKELTLDDKLSNNLYATVLSEEERARISVGFGGYQNVNSEMVIAKSINSGKNWELISLGVTAETVANDENRIVLNSKDDQKILLGSIEGVFRSQNGGLDWQSSNRGLGTLGGTVSITPDNTDVVHLVHNCQVSLRYTMIF